MAPSYSEGYQDRWTPQWTLDSLFKKKFAYLGDDTFLAHAAADQTRFFPESLDIQLVKNRDQADFIVIDDGMDPSNLKVTKPILTTTSVQMAFWLFMDCVVEPWQTETKPFSSLVEKVENEGSKITFTDDAVAYIKSHADSGEKVHREILLRDPIVRSFINIKDDRRKQLRDMIVQDPPRIDGTRWKLEDVQHDYMIETWDCDGKTWIHDWKPKDFNEDYGTPSDKITPENAVHAALFAFYEENELFVKALLFENTPPADKSNFRCNIIAPKWYTEAKELRKAISSSEIRAVKEWWASPKFGGLPWIEDPLQQKVISQGILESILNWLFKQNHQTSSPNSRYSDGGQRRQPIRRESTTSEALTSGSENVSIIGIVLLVVLALVLCLFQLLRHLFWIEVNQKQRIVS